MLITLSGLDGAGKSTLAEALRAALELDGTPVVLHMNRQIGLYAYVRSVRDALKRIMRGKGPKAPATRKTPETDPPEKYSPARAMLLEVRRRLIWNKALRRWIDLADLVMFLVYRVYIEKVRRRVLIMDRYFYDRAVDLAEGRRWTYLRWFARTVPVPDIPVFVDVSPEEAFARKGEYSVELMTQRRATYLQVFSWIPSSIILSNDNLDETVDELKRIVLGRMVKRAIKPGAGTAAVTTGLLVRPSLMVNQERLYASIILRLLLDGSMKRDEKRTVSWGDLLHIAAQNGVLIRVVDQLETIGLEPGHSFSAAVRKMRARNQRKLGLIARIGKQCVEARVESIFPKVLQSYPDMPGDIDLYIAPRSLDADGHILEGLQAVPLKRKLRNRIDATANYRLPGCDTVLEIHHGRVGMLGEHKLYIGQLIENSQYVVAEGKKFLIPSPEDQLILQALQRVVQRSYLRLSDVISTINILRENRLDWNYILKTVNSLNSFYGLSCYLSFVDQIYRETFGLSVLPHDLATSLISRTGRIEFKRGFYRFSRLTVGGRGYVDKFCSAVLAENWNVATRLSLLPVVALTTVVRKLRTS